MFLVRVKFLMRQRRRWRRNNAKHYNVMLAYLKCKEKHLALKYIIV